MNKESRVWPDSGIEPADGEEVVEGGEEYPAQFMNWILWALTTDVDTLVSDVSENTTDIGTLQTDVESNSTEITSLSGEKLDLVNYTPVSDVDGEITSAANSVSGLDSQVDSNQSNISGKADDPHGNESHTEDYVTQSEIPEDSYTDSDAVNAVDAEVSSAASSVSGLDQQVSGNSSDISSKADNPHGNEAHSSDFLSLPISDDFSINGYPIRQASQIEFTATSGYNAQSDLWTIGTTGATNDIEFVWDANTLNPALILNGSNAEISGDLSVGGNKPFVIDHPTRNDYSLRHCTYEGPVTGGLIYRDQVEVVDGTATPDFPDYVLDGDFGDDFIASITPSDHFGRAYLDTDTWTVHADQDGKYDVVVFGRRTDNGGLNRGGTLTEKKQDESWEDAGTRFYGGNGDDLRWQESATSKSVEGDAMHAHAKEQHEKE